MRRALSFLTAVLVTTVPVWAKGGAAPPGARTAGSAETAARPIVVKAVSPESSLADEWRALSTAKGLGIGSGAKGGPTCSTVEIACGATVNTDLLETDCALDDGTFVDFYVFDGVAGDDVTIDMMSEDFDTFLFLLDPTPEVIDVDDDSGAGTNSQITITLNVSGQWGIAANNFAPLVGDPGNYTLTLDCGGGTTPTPPAAPSNLTATVVGPEEIDLFWNDNSNNENDFQVQLAENGGAFQTIGAVPANSIGANVSGLDPETTYTFRVRARNAAGNSAFSNQVSATTPPDDGSPPSVCVADANTLCLNNDRFRVEVDFTDFNGNDGEAAVVPFGSDDSGLFFFFDPDNWEMLVKVLNGCGINDHFWVFAAATTNVEYTLRVTDTETGLVQEYFNPLGQAADAITDTSAFATCP